MKKKFLFYFLAVLFAGIFFRLSTTSVEADESTNCGLSLSTAGRQFNVTGLPESIAKDIDILSPLLQFSGLVPNAEYKIDCVHRTGNSITGHSWDRKAQVRITTDSNGNAQWALDRLCWDVEGDHIIRIETIVDGKETENTCSAAAYIVEPRIEGITCGSKSITNESGGNNCFENKKQFNWSFQINNGDTPYQGKVTVYGITNVVGGQIGAQREYTTDASGNISGEDTPIDAGDPIVLRIVIDGETISNCAIESPLVVADGQCTEKEEEETVENPNINDDSISTVGQFDYCQQAGDKSGECNICYSSGKSVWTAVGCISTDPTTGIKQLVSIGLSIAGGIALLMILVAAFQFSISKGDPKRTSEAKELLQSAIIGLLFILFSVTILQFIARDLFRIPNFGG